MSSVTLHTGYVGGVALSAIDGEIKMLLMKRTKGNYWCHVAGGIEENELAWQAIIREFKEETEIEVSTLYNAQFIEKFYEANQNVMELIPVFVVMCEPEQAIQLNHEHTEYRWCTLAEALALAPFPNQHEVYQHVWRYFFERTINPMFEVSIH